MVGAEGVVESGGIINKVSWYTKKCGVLKSIFSFLFAGKNIQFVFEVKSLFSCQ